MMFRRREGRKKEDIEYLFHQKDGKVTAVRGGACPNRCRFRPGLRTSSPVSITREVCCR
jgi:hypothetical protein